MQTAFFIINIYEHYFRIIFKQTHLCDFSPLLFLMHYYLLLSKYPYTLAYGFLAEKVRFEPTPLEGYHDFELLDSLFR